jgi:hypothetical protein
LSQVAQKIGAAMYQNQTPPNTPPTEEKKADDNVMEGEVEEKK